MTKPTKQPPDWNLSDPLSAFIADAQYNERVSAHNFAQAFAVLGKIHKLFLKCEETIEKDNSQALLVPRFLIVRVHSAYLASVRLSLSGQVFEAFPVLRAVIENAWYSLHIAKDPAPTHRAEIWLKRNDTDQDKSRCKSEFTAANVRATHEGLDAATAKELHSHYETLIDFGAHPNQFGVMNSLATVEAGDEKTFNVAIFAHNPLHIAFGLRQCAATSLGALKIFQLIFPERFTIVGLDQAVGQVVQAANQAFQAFSQPLAKMP